MLTVLLLIAVGIVIGWNWAREWQEKVVGFFRSIANKGGN